MTCPRLRHCLLIATALLCFALPAQGQSLSAIFEAGNGALTAGHAKEAAALYEQLVDAGVEDPDVYVNLGLAYARDGQYGRATYAFERALALSPGDAQAEQNLNLARSALGKRHAELHGEAIVERRLSFLQSIVGGIREPVLSWSLVITSALFFLILAIAPRTRSESARVAAGLAVPIFGLAFALSLGGVLLKADVFSDGIRGTVLDEDVPLLDAPDPRAKPLRSLAEGDTVRVIGHHGGYDEVRADAQRGWVPRQSVGSL